MAFVVIELDTGGHKAELSIHSILFSNTWASQPVPVIDGV